MNAFEVLSAARVTGIEVRTDDWDLVLEAPGSPPDDLLERLRLHKTAIVELLQPKADGWSAEDWQTLFNERAAIAEFDGGLPRDKAEGQAFAECISEWLDRFCAIRAGARPSPLQPCPRCRLAWRKEAVMAIESMGIRAE